MSNIKKSLTISLLAVLLIVAVLPFSAVFAEETTSADVLDELQHDSTFNADDYPELSLEDLSKAGKPLLEVIQVAESKEDKLYIYVYQPTNNTIDLKATAISMSCKYSSNGQDLDPSPYDLTLVSTSGVFDKYLVEDYKVSNDAYRYYNIVAIYREFNASIDTNTDGADSVEKAIAVGQQWCVYYLNDSLVYEMGTFETLEIEVQYTGSLAFSEGITIGNIFGSFTWGHSWFVAFNVEDYIVEHIYDAKLSYSVRPMTRVIGVGSSGEWSYGDFVGKEIWLKDTDTASYDGGGLFAKEYSWNRISSSEDFIANAEAQDVTISEECKNKLKESQWVFAFAETEKDEYYSEGATVTIQSDIDDVTILTLHFVDINHKIYNLGVVGDRVNPDNESDGYGGMDTDLVDDLNKALVTIYTILIIIVAVVLLGPLVLGALKYILNIRW